MPREVICVQIGQCGNQLGLKWWDVLLQEHLANPQYPEALESLFYHTNPRNGGSSSSTTATGGRPPFSTSSASGAPTVPPIDVANLKARCLAIDMEEGVLNSMMKGPLHSLFSTTHFISDVSGAGIH